MRASAASGASAEPRAEPAGGPLGD